MSFKVGDDLKYGKLKAVVVEKTEQVYILDIHLMGTQTLTKSFTEDTFTLITPLEKLI
jgi:hypothetical protein